MGMARRSVEHAQLGNEKPTICREVVPGTCCPPRHQSHQTVLASSAPLAAPALRQDRNPAVLASSTVLPAPSVMPGTQQVLSTTAAE
ncbi:hypothetical protein TREES_T100008546 [Tupaia chinensis]|uniref:Uncharacterized protein n=1 Tax=Tupaia chinensis TaxID=246437 RepID=L9L9W7_TUPCH|nr:hypothetical protein TREES_T100008546 [Tupaia chinensis]